MSMSKTRADEVERFVSWRTCNERTNDLLIGVFLHRGDGALSYGYSDDDGSTWQEMLVEDFAAEAADYIQWLKSSMEDVIANLVDLADED